MLCGLIHDRITTSYSACWNFIYLIYGSMSWLFELCPTSILAGLEPLQPLSCLKLVRGTLESHSRVLNLSYNEHDKIHVLITIAGLHFNLVQFDIVGNAVLVLWTRGWKHFCSNLMSALTWLITITLLKFHSSTIPKTPRLLMRCFSKKFFHMSIVQ